MRRLYEFTRRLSGLGRARCGGRRRGERNPCQPRPRRWWCCWRSDDDLELTAAWPPEDALDAAADDGGALGLQPQRAGRRRHRRRLPIIPWYFVPLRIGDKTLGVIGVAKDKDAPPLDSEARALLDTLSEQTAAALDRASLTREMVSAQTATETERVRNTLLASISHDFRTPLSSILGAATSLIDYGDKLDRGDQARPARPDQDGGRRPRRDGAQSAGHHPHRCRRAGIAARLDRSARDRRSRGQRGAAARRAADSSKSTCLPTCRWCAPTRRLAEQAIGNIVGQCGRRIRRRRRALSSTPSVAPDRVALRVSDDGPGIAPDALPRIFDKFVKGAEPSAVRAMAARAPGSVSPSPKASWRRMAARSRPRARFATGGARVSRLTFPREERRHDGQDPRAGGR